MSIKSLSILGLRGFASAQTLPLAIPNGKPGSGLTMLVGPNSGGKSTVIEAFRALSSGNQPSFTEGRRNHRAYDRITIKAEHSSGKDLELVTIEGGGSETVFRPEQKPDWANNAIFVLPSRRYFAPQFGKSISDRDDYIRAHNAQLQRSASQDQFSYRLFHIQKAARAAFDEVLARVISPVPAWSIEQAENGQYYIKVKVNGGHHSSEGLGEGIISLLFIVDALYDSKASDVIVIDEPELSLHPALQRKVAELINSYAATRQIVVATHSPYFTDFQSLVAGGSLSRVAALAEGSVIATVSPETIKSLSGLLANAYNPHILGLNAREVFFLNDGIILGEGQDDVVLYKSVAEQVGVHLEGDFFGWGVGGAPNMPLVTRLLRDLGFKRVAGILDSDQAPMLEKLRAEFPDYTFEIIPAKDVRTKPAAKQRDAVAGLLDGERKLRPEYAQETKRVLGVVAKASSQSA